MRNIAPDLNINPTSMKRIVRYKLGFYAYKIHRYFISQNWTFQPNWSPTY
uniref:Transposase n=1 Tax=Heterorhabditis bacteriophora TaxID=37862 RepID=A0A1I7WFI9_HETBA